MTIGFNDKKFFGDFGSGGECHLGRSVEEKWRRKFRDKEHR